jgi:dihydroneopterin aldolase
MSARDTISVSDLRVECVVGVYPHERDALQPLRVDVDMRLDTEQAATKERVRLTVDYASVSAQIAFLLRNCRFRLLETAAHVVARHLLAPPAAGERRAQVDELTLRLTKPAALAGNGMPTLCISRDKSWAVLGESKTPFGSVDVVHETRDAGIYRLNLAPGARIPLHMHRATQEVEMVLGDGLLCQSKPAPVGMVYRWPLGAAHGYENPTDRFQTILCLTSPRDSLGDDVRVEGDPAAVEPEPSWHRRPTKRRSRPDQARRPVASRETKPRRGLV